MSSQMEVVLLRFSYVRRFFSALLAALIFTTQVSPLGLFAVYAAVGVPQTISYQGRLKDSTGAALSGTYDFIFQFYDAASGGVLLATETEDDVAVTDGYFSVSLDLDGDIADFANIAYLDIQVKADADAVYDSMSSRVAINATPYSLFTRGIENSSTAPASNLFAGRMYFNTGDGLLYVYNGVSWTSLAAGGGGDNLDVSYNNFGAMASKINVDAAEGQTGGLEFESTISGNIIFDLQSTGDFVIQDAGSTYATFSDAGAIIFTGSTTANTFASSGATLTGGSINSTPIGNSSASTGAFTTLSSTGVTTLGNNSATVAINSSDWDIDATGAITGVSFDANGSGNAISNIESADILDGAIVNADLTNDTIDFDKMVDAGTLDASWTATGAAGKTITFARTLTDATSENGVTINSTASDSSSGTTAQYGLYLDNLASTEGLDASLVIDNSDADDVVGAAIKIINAGGGFTTLIDNAGTLISGAEFNILDGGVLLSELTDSGTLTATTVDINGGAIDGTAIGASSASTGAFTTLSSTGVTTIGNNSATVAINSSDWDINATGDMTNIGAITIDGAFSQTGATTFSTGTSTVSLNGATTVANGNTFTANGAVVLGDGGDTLAIDSLEFDVSSSTGAITINDGGDAGAVSVEGTNLDINSLDFAAAGTITSTGAGNDITMTAADDIIIDGADFDVTAAGNIDVSGTVTAGSGNEVLTLATGKIDADALTLIAALDGGTGTSSGSGLMTRTDGIGLLQGCADAEVLKWVESTDTWDCAADATGGSSSLDDAYNNGGTITVDAYDVLFNLADATNDYKLTVDNTTAGAIGTGLAFTTSGGGSLTTAIDVSAANIGTALAIGSNDVTVGGATLSSSEFAVLDSGVALSELTDSGTLTATTVDINGGAIDGTAIGASSASTGAFTTLASTGVTTLGNNSATVAINSSDWDISTTGAMTGIGAITMDGDFSQTGSTTFSTGSGTVSLNGSTTANTFASSGATITGGSINSTPIGNSTASSGAFTTLSSTGVTTLGNNSATVAINSSDWDIDATGAITGVSFDANGTGNSISNIESADIVDGTIANADLANDTIDFDKMIDSGTLDASWTATGAAGKTITFARTFTDATTENGVTINSTAADTTSGTTAQYGLYLDNLASTEGLDASLVIDNSDTDDAIGAAVKIINAGGGFTNIIDNAGTLISGLELNVLDGGILLSELTDTGTFTATTVDINGGAIDGTAIGASSASTGAFTTLASTGVTTIGNNSATVAVNSSDWDINATGDATGIGGLTMDGAFSQTGATTFSTGTSTISLNGATTVANGKTLTANGVVALGDGGDTVAIDSSDWDIDATGAITGAAFDANGTGNSLSNVDNADLTNDTIDFDKMIDAGTLDAAWSVSGAAGKAITFARTLTDATSENSMLINSTASDSSSGTTAQYGLYLDNLASTEGLDASLVIDNSDADDVIGAAIKIINAGGGFTNIIDNAGTLISGLELNVLDGGILLSELTDTGTLTATTVDINGGAIDGTAIGASSASTGAFTTLSSTGVTTIGNNSATVAINSSDWDINATGDMTGIGGLTMDGAFSQTGATTFSTGTSTVSLNGATTVANGNTFTANGIVALGDNGDTVTINSSDWDIDATGVMTGIGAITSDGLITTSDDLAVNGGDFTSTSGTFNFLDAASNSATIEIGGVTTDLGNTVRIATNATTADTITIGNTTATTALTLNSGTWNIASTGVQTMTATSSQITALVITDTDYTNALSIDDNNIVGTTFTLTGTTAAIDFTNFDVGSNGVITVAAGAGLDTNAAGALALGNTNATSASLCNSAACDTISIGTNTDADTITIGDSTDTTSLIGGAAAVITFTDFSVASTGATTITPDSNVAGLTVTGTNVTSANLLNLDSRNTTGTLANIAYGGATTQGAGALTGLAVDLNTNLTTPAAGRSVTGISLSLPTVSTTSLTTTYSGYALTTVGTITNGTAGSVTWNGTNVTIPNLTQSAGGSVTANGALITTGSITTAGIQNALNVTAAGVGAGTLNGLNISAITAGAGTEVGATVGDGWDTGISIGDDTTELSLTSTSPTIAMANTGTLTFTDGTNNMFRIIDGGTTGSVTVTGNATIATGSIFTASNANISLTPNGSGDIVLASDGNTNMQITTTGSAPTADMIALTNTGQSSATTGVDAVSLVFDTSNASGDIIHTTPAYAGGATDTLTYNVFEADAFSPTNSAGTDTVNGILLGALTDPGATITSSGIKIGSGWDNAISGTTAGTNVISFTNFVVTTAGVVTAQLNTATGATGPFALCHETNGNQNEAIKDCNGAPLADYAERYPVASDVTYGDIIVPGTQAVYQDDVTNGHQVIVQGIKSSTPYQGPVIGVVSNNYGDFTSAGNNIKAEDNPMPVALVGRVPVNVTSENGPIAVGDFITTSSTPGKGMKATEAGRVIGMALGSFTGTSGQVMVQIINTWYQPPITDASPLQGGNNTTAMLTSSAVQADSLVVLGTARFEGSVTIKERLYAGQDVAGRARIKAGDDSVTVTFPHPYMSTPIVNATLRTSGEMLASWWVGEENENGFTLHIDRTLMADVEFNWMVLGTDEGVVTISDGTTEVITSTMPAAPIATIPETAPPDSSPAPTGEVAGATTSDPLPTDTTVPTDTTTIAPDAADSIVADTTIDTTTSVVDSPDTSSTVPTDTTTTTTTP